MTFDSEPLITDNIVPFNGPIRDCNFAFSLQATEAVDEPLSVALAISLFFAIAKPDELLDDLEHHVLPIVEERLPP